MALIGLWSGPITSLLFGPLGPGVAPILRLALGPFPLQFGVVFLSLALQALRYERTVLAILSAGAAIGLILALALVPSMGASGAVIARLLSASVLLTALLWTAYRALR